MKRVAGESKFAKGRRGNAILTKLSDTKLRIDFEETEKEKAVGFGLDYSTGEEGTCPECLPFKSMKENGQIRLSATMDENGKRILYANPFNGEFTLSFEKFMAPDGQAPAPETKMGKNNKQYKVFTAFLVVTKGAWKGARFLHNLYPNFGKDDEGNLAVSGKGTGTENLADFLQAVGVYDTVIPYSENPLPEIEKIAQAEKKEFQGIVSKGRIDTVLVPLNGAFEEEDSGVHPALAE